MNYQYTMLNTRTREHITKIQKTEPRIKGMICVDKSKVLPQVNSRGERLFHGANGPYYARVLADGSHYQP